MVATASTEHSYWLELAFVAWFLAVFVYATHATQAIAFEWKPGFTHAYGSRLSKTIIRAFEGVCLFFVCL